MQPAEAEVDQFLPRPLGAEASGSPLGCPSGFMAAPQQLGGEWGLPGPGQGQTEKSKSRASVLGVGAWPCHSFGVFAPTRAEIRMPPACLGRLGDDRPQCKESPSRESTPVGTSSHPIPTQSPSPRCPGVSVQGHVPLPGHIGATRGRHKPAPPPPAKPLTAGRHHPSAPLTSSHLMKRSPWLR